MAKIHVLAGAGPNLYTVVVHATTPVGNNSAGIAWSDAIKNSGRATSILTVGTGAGQILNAEMNQITGGTLIEGSFAWGDDPAWSNAERQADLDLRATQLVAELLARYQQDLKYFGFTRT
jgi:hypothetical protein